MTWPGSFVCLSNVNVILSPRPTPGCSGASSDAITEINLGAALWSPQLPAANTAALFEAGADRSALVRPPFASSVNISLPTRVSP